MNLRLCVTVPYRRGITSPSLGDGGQSVQEALASALGLVDGCSPPDDHLILIAKSAGEVATPHRLEPPDLSSLTFSQKWKLLVVAVFTAPQFPAPYTSGSTPGPLVRVYLHSECVRCFYEFGLLFLKVKEESSCLLLNQFCFLSVLTSAV